MYELEVGSYGSPQFLSVPHEERLALVALAENLGLDHLFVGDHVSFHNGFGMDGIVDAASLAAMSGKLKVMIGVYLLALRHPLPVARQLASLLRCAPGRITLGIGLGGEDRNEMQMCGVDPATRGQLTNHCMRAVRELLRGEPTDYDCEFFSFANAQIKPAPNPPLPMMVGGRSDAAIRRTAQLGDGWLGLWCSANRFAQATTQVAELAETGGRKDVTFRHGMQVWVGFGDKARDYLAAGMRDMYQLPFEPFEKYSPYGSPLQVAEFLAPYVERGASVLNLAACGESLAHEIECVAEVKSLLKNELERV